MTLSLSHTKQFNSHKELKEHKEQCKLLKRGLDKALQADLDQLHSSNKSKEELIRQYDSQYTTDCRYVDNFEINQLSADNVTSWLLAASQDVSGIYEIIKGADEDLLKQLLKTGKGGWLQSPASTSILSALGEEIEERLGGSKKIKVNDLKEFGSAAVYMIPPVDYKDLSDEVFKHILGFISEETEKSLGPNTQGVDFRANSLVILRSQDSARIKALCSRAFQLYKRPNDINNDDGWKNIKFLMFCAPSSVCKSVQADLIQDDISSLIPQQWTCRNMALKIDIDNTGPQTYIDGLTVEEYIMHWEKETLRLFPSNKICGKIIADKLVNEGKNPYKIKTMEDVGGLQFLSACLPDAVMKEQVDTLGCEFARETTARGILSHKMTDYAVKKCASAVYSVNNISCDVLNTTYKPFLRSMKRSFFKQLPQHVMCDSICVDIFKEELPEDMMKYIMKNCYRDANISSDVVEELGGLVVDLPVEKFDDISTHDLETNIGQIKKDLKGLSKSGGKKAVVKKLARKMMEGGNIAELVDSSEIMKEVSLKDLKASLANSSDIIQDLGINNVNGKIGMTDSQKKWAMKEIMKKKQPENFQLQDLLEMKSLVTGLLSSHIKKMGQAHSSDSGGMELAAEMCSHSGWPRKSLEAINKYLIQSSLEVRNTKYPASSLTVVDVQGLGCECLLNFDAVKYEQMDSDVCSAMCTKIGYCDTFRCMNPIRKKNVLQACLKCKELETKVITETDFDELGPNLISQMSQNQLDLVPAEVLNSGIELFKDMCMDQTLRTAVSNALQQVIGRSGSYYTSETLYLLGSAIKLLPRSLQQQLDESILAEMQTALIEEIVPDTEEETRLKKCCEKWFDEADLDNMKEQNVNLMLTLKETMFAQSDTLNRRKRASTIFNWTCRLMRPLPVLFVTASSDEIEAMDDKEFLDCLSIIGRLDKLKGWQRTLLLAKAKKVLPEDDICKLTVSDIETLGVIALALSSDEINCLPVNDTNLVAFLGGLKEWSAVQLESLSERYVSVNSLSTLSGILSTDIAMLGSIMCGFTADLIASIPSVEVGRSGEDIWNLKQCSIELMKAFVMLAMRDDAYGPIDTWDAADVIELKYIVVGLSGAEIQQLSVNAIEGLLSGVIRLIPKHVLKEMNRNQLKAFSDIQSDAVTDTQKEAMTVEQRNILDDMPTKAIVGYGKHGGSSGRRPEAIGSLVVALVLRVVIL